MFRRMGMAAIAAVFAASCHNNAAPRKPWSFEEHIGVASQRSGKECLEIMNSSVAANSLVYLVSTAEPQTFEQGTIVSREESCRNPYAETPEAQAYEIKLAQKSTLGFMPAIAIVDFGGAWEKRGALVEANLDGEGQAEYFRSCTSNEGIHFTVWTGQPITGILRWHHYRYLGYDVTPDCKTEEMSLKAEH